MDTTLIDSIDWDNLSHAYGVASDAPSELKNLLSNNQDARENAVYGFLYSSAYHKGDVYSCTPDVILCVLHIIKNEDIDSLEVISSPLIRELMGFISACARTWKFEPKIGKAVYTGKELYGNYLEHTDEATSEHARNLVKICDDYEKA